MFDGTVRGLVKDVLEGQNSLVFTYGVTNAGKTFTFLGLCILFLFVYVYCAPHQSKSNLNLVTTLSCLKKQCGLGLCE